MTSTSSWTAAYGAAAHRLAPHHPPGGQWRFSAVPSEQPLPRQGWKIHVSATVRSATESLLLVGPVLQRRGSLFKVPASLGFLEDLNAGVFPSYPQVGKFLTIYPTDVDDFLSLIDLVVDVLPDLPCPTVPFDRRVRRDRPVFYRYGVLSDDDRSLELVDPEGTWRPDVRDGAGHHPDWVVDPLPLDDERSRTTTGVPPIAAYATISQRGKGGVYEALDFSVAPARKCVLKEGRRHGEVDVHTGRDGADHVEREQRVLSALGRTKVRVPTLLTSFHVDDHAYSVLERVEGESLTHALWRHRFSYEGALTTARRLAEELWRLHEAGWIWRDCKPSNVIVRQSGHLCLIDFEGACRAERPDPTPFGSPVYMSGSSLTNPASPLDDVYAMGVCFHELFGGRLELTRHGVRAAGDTHLATPKLASLIGAMRSERPWERPSSARVVAQLVNDY
jgi:tRNA A-37 threonylcarbamoyl transferase component Bud32